MNKFEYCLLDAASGFFSSPDCQESTSQLPMLGSQVWGNTIGGEATAMPNQARGLLRTLRGELLG